MARKTGRNWVSSSNQIVYLKPALLMETVTIQSQLIYFDKSNLKAEMRMYNHDKSELKSFIWCSFVHYDLLNLKRANHADDMMQLFNDILNPINAITFEERLKQFKPQKEVK
ncbi:thioesterase family protein [Winogradskyella sp. PG-2]|uniref:thioesterase family protein n=1 Tax=Winogradskyella sp. PG-2 TaxID=754409 RepID=UPI001E65A676|nr:thioesterase family protein [Winogradskyella sp. PG-2]